MAYREYDEKAKEEISSADNSIPARVINPIPHHRRDVIFSLKNNRAITDVATISKLLRRDIDSACACFIATIRSIGAAISRTTIAERYGRFLCEIIDLVLPCLLEIKYTAVIPIPAPRYRNPANIVGGSFSSRIFENGVLSAYSKAASMAYRVAFVLFIISSF